MTWIQRKSLNGEPRPPAEEDHQDQDGLYKLGTYRWCSRGHPDMTCKWNVATSPWNSHHAFIVQVSNPGPSPPETCPLSTKTAVTEGLSYSPKKLKCKPGNIEHCLRARQEECLTTWSWPQHSHRSTAHDISAAEPLSSNLFRLKPGKVALLGQLVQ